MAYRDFNLKTVKNQFDLQLVENQSLFSEIAPLDISEHLLGRSTRVLLNFISQLYGNDSS
jgi:hypothetical protein